MCRSFFDARGDANTEGEASHCRSVTGPTATRIVSACIFPCTPCQGADSSRPAVYQIEHSAHTNNITRSLATWQSSAVFNGEGLNGSDASLEPTHCKTRAERARGTACAEAPCCVGFRSVLLAQGQRERYSHPSTAGVPDEGVAFALLPPPGKGDAEPKRRTRNIGMTRYGASTLDRA